MRCALLGYKQSIAHTHPSQNVLVPTEPNTGDQKSLFGPAISTWYLTGFLDTALLRYPLAQAINGHDVADVAR